MNTLFRAKQGYTRIQLRFFVIVVIVIGQPEVGLKNPISPQWSMGSLSDWQAWTVTKQQWTNCVGSLRETDAYIREIFVQHGFLQNGRYNSYQMYWYDSSTCEQPTADKLQLYCETNTLFALSTQAYNSSHFYIVRLVWFPGYMDWERRNIFWEMSVNTNIHGPRSFAQCVFLVNIL